MISLLLGLLFLTPPALAQTASPPPACLDFTSQAEAQTFYDGRKPSDFTYAGRQRKGEIGPDVVAAGPFWTARSDPSEIDAARAEETAPRG